MKLCQVYLAIGLALVTHSSAGSGRSISLRASRLQVSDRSALENDTALAEHAALNSKAASSDSIGLLCREYNAYNNTDIDVVLQKDGARDLVFSRTIAAADGLTLGFESQGVQSRVHCAPDRQGARCSPVKVGKPVPKCSAIDQGACKCQADTAIADHLPYQRFILGQALDRCLAHKSESQPYRALALGLGGGAMPMYLRHKCKAAQVESVEVDPRVIAVAQRLLGFRPDGQNKVECADALESLKRREAVILRARDAPHYDLALVDCFENGQVPESCSSDVFVGALHAVVRPGGSVFQNVLRKDVDPLLHLYKGFFGKVNVTKIEEGNFLITASKGA
mmetsp:Transcript_87687/g.151960  ORF Transcript_87687/g.151960 Transcript_87687/m.151960 type:complete len:337 (-) Transcript_87687:99-1109(-)